ncbi:MAG: hypothetical protein JWR34_5202 [Mycobacterium sp.]|nr:hypothetical protein [Mycobacterium sp.]
MINDLRRLGGSLGPYRTQGADGSGGRRISAPLPPRRGEVFAVGAVLMRDGVVVAFSHLGDHIEQPRTLGSFNRLR